MPAANPYFEILHLGERVELRPSERLVSSKVGPAGCVLLLPLPMLALSWLLGDNLAQMKTPALVSFGICVPLWLLFLWANRRRRRLADIPLVIGPGPSVRHGAKVLNENAVLQAVQLQEVKPADEADGFDVLLLVSTGEKIVLPDPFFGYLDLDEAISLANELANQLQIPFERQILPAQSK